MPQPSDNIFNALKTGLYQEEYFDAYTMGSGTVNPLQNVIPCFDLIEGRIPDFFGPYSLNIIAFTGPYCKGDGSDEDPFKWDDEDVEKCVEILKKAYPIYARYEVHYMFDGDSENIADAEDETLEAIAFTKGKLITLVGDLIEFGAFYWGELAQAELAQKVNEIIADFYQKTRTEG